MAEAREEIVAVLAQIVSEVAGIPASEVGPGTGFGTAGIGPLQLTHVVEQAEARWDLGIPDADMDFATVGELADYITRWQG